jgi:uncharacterized protein (DUF934 family)
MPDRIIRKPAGRKARVEADAWTTLGVDPGEEIVDIPAGPVIVPLAVWQSRRGDLEQRGDPFGVWLKPDDEPSAAAADLGRFAIVAVHFPKHGDGRGYSTGVLLRTRFGYRGELRAFGDVGRDHLLQLARCGFDAFRLAGHRDPDAALAAFDELGTRYQGSVDDPVPLFRKRIASGAPS